MPETKTLEVTCDACGMPLELRYQEVAPPVDVPPLGCPECQSTGGVQATFERLQEGVRPQAVQVVALQPAREIGEGVGRRRRSAKQTGVPPEALHHR